MLRIGLTGGIASGKSTVAACLRELGATVIDADRLAREVVRSGTAGLRAVIEAFGPEYLDEAGGLERARLADLVFFDADARRRLNAIVHPLVRQRMAEEAALAEKRGERAVVLDIPLLFESGLEATVDEIWLVAVPPTVQVARLRERNGYDEEQARARLESQLPLEAKIGRAHVVIWNDGALEATCRRVRALWQERGGGAHG
jgi:dephospho-CoA kinase